MLVGGGDIQQHRFAESSVVPGRLAVRFAALGGANEEDRQPRRRPLGRLPARGRGAPESPFYLVPVASRPVWVARVACVVVTACLAGCGVGANPPATRCS